MFARISALTSFIYGNYDPQTGAFEEIGTLGQGGWSDSFRGVKHELITGTKVEELTAESFDSNDQAAGFEVVDGEVVESNPDPRIGEDFPTYLRRVASDYKESDPQSATAEDYVEMAKRIEKVLSIVSTWERKWDRAAENRPVGFRAIREALTDR